MNAPAPTTSFKSVIVYALSNADWPCWKRADPLEAARLYMSLQIENSLRIGWKADDIVCLTNFDHEAFGVKCVNIASVLDPVAGSCIAKHHGARWALETYGCPVYLRDHDCYQLQWFDCAPILGNYDFVVSGGKPPRISDQSCFMSPHWLPFLTEFLNMWSSLPLDQGVGFRLGAFAAQWNTRIVPYPQFPWRFNLVSPRWRKELLAMTHKPLVAHQRLGCTDMAEFLAQQNRYDFLALYARYSAALNELCGVLSPRDSWPCVLCDAVDHDDAGDKCKRVL